MKLGNGEKTVVILILGLLLSTISYQVSAQTTAPVGMEPRFGGTFVYVLSTDPGNLNPAITTDFNVGQGADPAYEGLTFATALPGYPAGPALAESWESSADAKIWTFHLVKNATFQDGIPFTSADVKFTVEKILVPYHPGGKTIWQNLTSVDTPDNYTVTFNFNQGFGPLPQFVTIYWCPILPMHLWNGTDILKNPYNLKPLGTGPFVFKEYQAGQFVSYTRNPNYRLNPLPYLDGVIARVIPDETSRSIAYEKGEVNFMAPFIAPYAEGVKLANTPGTYIPPAGAAWNEQDMNYMVVNSGNLQSPVSNKLVRQAISYAMDRDTYVNLTTYGLDTPALSFFHATSSYYTAQPPYTYNTTKAEQLLDQAGYPRGNGGIRFTLKLRCSTDDLGRKKADVTASMLAKVGIACDVQLTDYTTMKTLVFIQEDYDISYVVGFTTGPDPYITARFFTKSGLHYPPLVFTNNAKYNNSRVDELYDLAVATSNVTQRQVYYNEIQQILWEDLPYIPISDANFPQIASTDFINVPPSAKSTEQGLEKVWWVGGTPSSAITLDARVTDLENSLSDLKGNMNTLTTLMYASLAISLIALVVAGFAVLRRKKT